MHSRPSVEELTQPDLGPQEGRRTLPARGRGGYNTPGHEVSMDTAA